MHSSFHCKSHHIFSPSLERLSLKCKHVLECMFYKTNPGESDHVSELQMHPMSNEMPNEAMSTSQSLMELSCQSQAHQNIH